MRYVLQDSCLICNHANLRDGMAHCENPVTLQEGISLEMKYDAVCKRFLLREFEYVLEMIL